MSKVVLFIPLVLNKYCDCQHRQPRSVYFGVQDSRQWNSFNKFLLSTYCSAGYQTASRDKHQVKQTILTLTELNS